VTRMACPAQVMDRETAFLHALGQASRFEAGDHRLQLLGADSQLLAELVADD